MANSSKDKEVCKLRADRGTLISSGLIAGGALFGVFAAVTIMCGWEVPDISGQLAPQIIGVIAYAALIAYLYIHSCMGKKR